MSQLDSGLLQSTRQESLKTILGLQINRYMLENPGSSVSKIMADLGTDAAKWKNILDKIPSHLKPYVEAGLGDAKSDGKKSLSLLNDRIAVNYKLKDYVAKLHSIGVKDGVRSSHIAGVRRSAFGGTRFGPQAATPAAAKLKSALAMGLKEHYKKEGLSDVTDPAQAAVCFAKPLVAVGISPAKATAAMLDSLHHTIAEVVDVHGHATEQDVAAAPVEDLHEVRLPHLSLLARCLCVFLYGVWFV